MPNADYPILGGKKRVLFFPGLAYSIFQNSLDYVKKGMFILE